MLLYLLGDVDRINMSFLIMFSLFFFFFYKNALMRFFISGICLDCPVVYSGLYRSISQCSVQGLHNSTSTCPRPTGLSGERWRVREVENGMWGCVWPNTKGSGSEWGAASVSLSLLKTRLGLEPTETVYWLQPGGIQRCREREREVCVVTSGDFKGRISWSVVCNNSSL